MKTSARSFVCALLLLSFLSSASYAGMDAHRAVVSLSGKVWVRSFTRKKDKIVYESWKPVRVGQDISPNSEIRVDKGGTLCLEMGDAVTDLRKRPSDEKHYYDILLGGSRVRLNTQHWAVAHKTSILKVLEGRVDSQMKPGLVPAKEYWSKKLGPNFH